jgi:alpha-beta hydrolase superfamily lysophospholipase
MSREKRPRPKLPKISEEMKAWSAALAAEVTTWPHVLTRPMFGMTALYRGKRIFAVLPRSRCLDLPNSLGLKLKSPSPRIRKMAQRDPHIRFGDMTACWWSFEMNSNADIRPALDWLGRAYEAAD